MEKSVGRLVSILYRKNQVYLNQGLKPFDVTAAELPLLLYLYKHEGVSQDALSNYTLIDKASTARMIQSLLNKGFINKEKDKEDRRANQIFLTSKSWLIKDGICKVLAGWNDLLLGELTQEQNDVMFESLEHMVKKVEALDFRIIGEKHA